MFKEIFDTVKENPILAIGAVVGLLGGKFAAGLLETTSTVQSIFVTVLLGVVGLAAGLIGANFVKDQIDKNTPAPLGVRTINTPALEPGKAGSIAFKPTAQLSQQLMGGMESQLKDNPDLQKYASYLPMIKMALPYTKIEMHGISNAENTQITLSSVTITPPMRGAVTFDVSGISLPLKDGKIDQESPEAKAKIKEVWGQAITKMLPPELRDQARKLLDTALGATPAKTEGEPVSYNDPARSTEMLAQALEKGTSSASTYQSSTIPYLQNSSNQRV